MPTNPIPMVIDVQDKLLHILAYGGLAFLLCLAATMRQWIRDDSLWVQAYRVILTAALLGAVDELTQYFVPGRVVDFIDWIADLLGCIAGTLCFPIVASRLGQKAKKTERTQNADADESDSTRV